MSLCAAILVDCADFIYILRAKGSNRGLRAALVVT